MKFENILNTIGNTPHIRLKKLFPSHEVWLKLESRNPAGSIKDRIALSMIESAEKKGTLKKGSIIIEPTSGNTGIALSMIAAVKGYEIIIVMPESMSLERRKMILSYGAKLELTPKEKGMKGAIEKAKELLEKNPHSWMPMQFENLDNPKIHEETTALEICNDFPEGIDYLFAGIGTGGHISGVGRVLKKTFPQVKIFGIEPADSAVLNGNSPGPHALQGIGAGFVPQTLDRTILTDVLKVEKSEAFLLAQKLVKTEGILAGISTGATLAALSKKISSLKKEDRILIFAYDSGERYFSVEGLF